MTAIIPTHEPPTETKRHPWVCNWKQNHATCNQPNRANDSHCVRCGKPYALHVRPSRDVGDTIAERVTIADAVREYVYLSQTVRELFAQLDAIETRLGVLFRDQSNGDSVSKIDLNSRGHDRGVDYARPDDVLDQAEREIWQAVVARSGVSRIASNKRWEQMQRELSNGKLPPLTPENVSAWVTATVGDSESILREKVIEVFDFLRPRHDHFKTNSQFEIGKKVILEYMVETADARWGWKPRLRWERRQIINSLETLFRNLDGHGQILSGWESELSTAIGKCEPDNANGETTYFKFKCHRNGTLHLTFKRHDLVEKLNAIAGGKALRGNRKPAG